MRLRGPFRVGIVVAIITVYSAVVAANRDVMPGEDFVSIVNGASIGDEVRFAAGTYAIGLNDDLLVPMGVKLVGKTGNAADVIITRVNSADWHRCVYMGDGAKLHNLTVRGGRTLYQGGAVLGFDAVGNFFHSNFSVSNCIVEGASALYEGGGANGGTWYDCVIRNCEVRQANNGSRMLYRFCAGGGIYGATLYNCVITNNVSGCYGGGVAGCDEQPLVAVNCLIADNRAPLGGGAGGINWDPGIEMNSQSIKLTDCRLERNRSAVASGIEGSGQGGGGYNVATYNCWVVGNESEAGAALCRGYHQGDLIISNRLTGAAWRDSPGSAVSPRSESVRDAVAVNCTAVGNSGGAAAMWSVCMTNCIASGNEPFDVMNTSLSRHSCFGTKGDDDEARSEQGLVQMNPKFVDRPGIHECAYSLSLDSPCVDAGEDLPWMAGTTDLLGHARRFVGTAVDMGACERSEVDIDKLCPPRSETSAAYAPGTYRPASRPYRDAALSIYRYMTSLPAMTVLVETGKPDQGYQQNVYVSKMHASHIEAMLEWAHAEPTQRAKALRFARASAEYLLTQLEPADAPLAHWPPTYAREPFEREPDAATRYRYRVMLVYPADVGIAFLDYYRETNDARFREAAVGIGETYLKTRRPDGSWSLLKVLATGEDEGSSTLVPNRTVLLFESLYTATGDERWRAAADAAYAWLDAHPLTDWNWDGQFEDVAPQPPYVNPTMFNAVETMLYMLNRFTNDAQCVETSRRIMDFSEKRFVVWSPPSNHPKWPTPTVLEQYMCFKPIDGSVTTMIRGYEALYRADGNDMHLRKAQALANAITFVQKSSGRVPTYWDGIERGCDDKGLSTEKDDWMNCMASSAKALLLLDPYPFPPGNVREVCPDDDFVSIVNGADIGDEIRLAVGTYAIGTNVNLLVPYGVKLVGKTGNASDVIITRESPADGLRCIHLNEGASIQNLTVRGGRSNYQSGGVFGYDIVYDCTHSNFSVSNCIVEGASALYEGGGSNGGVWYDSIIRNCEVRQTNRGGSRFKYGAGGGIYGATLYNCVITNNVSGCYGGGVAGCDEQPLVAVNCLIADNRAPLGGGAGGINWDPGIEMNSQSIKLTDCRLERNRSAVASGIEGSGQGGGGYNVATYNCWVVGNESEAGAALCRGYHQGDLIVSNRLTGVACQDSPGSAVSPRSESVRDAVAVNCTAVGNSGGAAAMWSVCMTNCIASGNEPFDVMNMSLSRHSCFGTKGDAQVLDPEWSLIQADPKFMLHLGRHDCAYSLSADSPCVNTGENHTWMINAIDILGTPRINRGHVDMGACESRKRGTYFIIGNFGK